MNSSTKISGAEAVMRSLLAENVETERRAYTSIPRLKEKEGAEALKMGTLAERSINRRP